MRCAIYARYSSNQQSPDSIDDQIRKCREYADKQSWAILDQHICSDAAISGESANRPGLQAMLAAAFSKPRPFDVLLLDDTSRLSRRMVDSVGMVERLKFAGVRVISVSQGIDSDDEQSDTLMMVHSWKDGLYIKELRKKTHRGLEGRALKGLHTGGRTFGYDIEKLAEGGARLVVNESEAPLVRRIFEMFAAGSSLKTIAGSLNAEKIPPPRLRAGKSIASWCPSAIRAILHNESYIGRIIWNRSQFVKDPQNGKRQRRPRPRNEWTIKDLPEIRIVSVDLWQRVLDRQKVVQKLFCQPGSGQNRTGGHLLSGFLKCGECGGNMIIVGRQKYGCREYHVRRAACTNKLTIAQSDIESQLFAELQKQVLTQQAIDYVLTEVGRRMADAKHGASAEIVGLEKRRVTIEKELRNLTGAIAATGGSQAVMAEIVAKEREREEITSRLALCGKDAFEYRIDELKAFMLSSLSDIRDLLTVDPARAKDKLSKHVTPIRLTPGNDGYTVDGEWNLLGSGTGVNFAGVGFEPTTFGL